MKVWVGASPTANKNGQVLGPKGRRSRDRIIAETIELLKMMPVTELNMAAVVRRMGMTPAAYLLYFDDIGEAVLAALEQPSREFLDLGDLVARPWPPTRTYDCALEFVDAYFEIWKRHFAVLRARNVLADSADARFEAVRAEAAMSIIAGLVDKLTTRPPQVSNGHDVAPGMLAKVLLTAVERSAIVTTLDLHGRSRQSCETRHALAHLFDLAL